MYRLLMPSSNQKNIMDVVGQVPYWLRTLDDV